MIDLFAGLGGWAEGGLAEGFDVVGFDIERHVYGAARYPAQLVLQDILTLHGSQFKDAALIVASPPCQEFSYMAMPWKKAKEKARRLLNGEDDPKRLTALFEACFRLQREAEEAAGRPIPLVVENVCGAQKWVGRARWHFGSFYLWGDVPALMPIVTKRRMKFPANCGPRLWSEREYQRLNDGSASGLGHREGKTTKNDGGSWFAVAHNTTSGHSQNPDRLKTAGHPNIRDGKHSTKFSGSWFGSYADMKANGLMSPGRLYSPKSPARKAASAHIAKIPLALARHIAGAWKPVTS